MLWWAINKVTGVRYGPYSDDYKAALTRSVYSRRCYDWEPVPEQGAEPPVVISQAVKPAQAKNELAQSAKGNREKKGGK